MKQNLSAKGVASLTLPLILFALVALGAGSCWAWGELSDIPGASQGEIVFYVDVVSFYQDEDYNTEEIYCVVANDQIEFLEEEGSYRGNLRYTVTLVRPDGQVVGSSENTLEVRAESQEDTSDRSVVQILQSSFEVEPGQYTVQATLEDLNARKKEVISYLRGKYKSGEVEVEVVSPRFQPGAISISDIEFARSLRRRSEGAFQKSGFEVIPNAQRRYGLLLAELPVYFEVYDRRPSQDEDTLLAKYSIVNRAGVELFGAENPIVLKGSRLGSTALFDITSLSAGSYLLSLSLVAQGGQVLASSQRKFDVVWSVYSWGRYAMEALGDLTYIFTDQEMETFKSLSPGEQEEFLRTFWLKMDPSPGTAENEALIEHFRRVRYADQHYGGAGRRGALSDRGILYIKYGPPDDINSYYSDYEFVKGTRSIEGSQDPVPTDPFSRVGIKTGSAEAGSWDQSGSLSEAHADQRGGSTVHGKAYEVWTYDGSGEPVRRLSERLARSAGMRFVLVDERGFGDYKLVYSSEKEEY